MKATRNGRPLELRRETFEGRTANMIMDVRICFSVHFYDDEAVADAAARETKRQRNTYNGGMFHGMACGRSPWFDFTDDQGRRWLAVTW